MTVKINRQIHGETVFFWRNASDTWYSANVIKCQQYSYSPQVQTHFVKNYHQYGKHNSYYAIKIYLLNGYIAILAIPLYSKLLILLFCHDSVQ